MQSTATLSSTLYHVLLPLPSQLDVTLARGSTHCGLASSTGGVAVGTTAVDENSSSSSSSNSPPDLDSGLGAVAGGFFSGGLGRSHFVITISEYSI